MIDLDHADRQGPARPHCRPAAHRQDRALAKDGDGHYQESSRNATSSCFLIDERPEEVTDMVRTVKGPRAEVVSSTFDEPTSRHVQVSEMVSKRPAGWSSTATDVVIFLDSITRLARAYNTEVPSSGKILSGGVDANALAQAEAILRRRPQYRRGRFAHDHCHRPRRYGLAHGRRDLRGVQGNGQHGAAPRPQAGRQARLAGDQHERSGTRKEELLRPEDELKWVYILHKVLSDMNPVEAMEMLTNRMGRFKSNGEFLSQYEPVKGSDE